MAKYTEDRIIKLQAMTLMLKKKLDQSREKRNQVPKSDYLISTGTILVFNQDIIQQAHSTKEKELSDMETVRLGNS